MSRRVVVALLGPVTWTPPGIDPARWRTALAEDVVDLLATLNEVETAVAVTSRDRWLADAVVWPGTQVYEVPEPTPNAVFTALAGDRAARDGGAAGYDQVAVVAADAPDVPGLTLGKLLRPLTTRPVAVAPVEGSGTGLLGVAARLPVPAWLPALDLDTTAPAEVRRAAPSPGDVAVTAGWHRMRGPADLAALDPAVEGWEATRALLSGRPV
ncbi:hypothetical protein [Micromonospora aurantiaca (nom. illeg.)]|uniref:MobA-like NTP transferase domain-containing protein n=1 Tax=Micromonospora aurantiaca (nom. illeg.) TaxID=47850 RepID=A0ABQ6U8F7_9ACTN|nr:hypothetical protein [Micromonospora aurantiaca]KAB1103432.1 hypothetical protein F6X54_29195 [Micromonospora aurantiaca]UFN93762.1 hypothetical protein LF814_28030 [Micromonospora aurantiaca]